MKLRSLPRTLTRRARRAAPGDEQTTGRETKLEPRTVRVDADETVEVSFTVNGTPATRRLPARVTLADALRDHLGLTGTHLGCEHGVCGMCTVLVDGDAARSCLLFACQLDGSDVITVEGLGSPDNLHPLQEAFGRHHGLQCGFCTPGFLLSAYDLLDHQPGVTPEELPEELSGVLCRCTGYRNILTAVADVASAHPDGIPGPRNCGMSALVGRASQAGAVRTQPAGDGQQPDARERGPQEVRLPQGEPTVTIEVASEVDVAPEKVWRVIDDTETLARCLPGAELTEDLGDDRYRGRARVALGPINLSFAGAVHVVERDAQNRRLRVLGQGEDAAGGRVQADIRLAIEALPQGSRLRADARAYLVGRIAQFGRSLADDVSRSMFEQFAAAVGQAASGRAPDVGTQPTSALRLLAATLTARLRRVVRRLRRSSGSPPDK